MKKLLILSSMMVVACTLNAASFTWGFGSSDIQDSTGNYIDGGTAFLYLGTVATTATTYDLTGTTLLAYAGQNGDPDYNFGVLSGTTSSDALSSTTAGQAYTLILIEASGKTTLDGYSGNMIVSTGTSTQGVNPMDESDTWAIFKDATAYTASSWSNLSAAAVPEPTSGLLLLLGVAGLALKRKHA